MKIEENISLKPFNTFGIDAKARYFSSFASTEELSELLQEKEARNKEQLLILGGGSNVLFTKDFDGWVLKNGLKGIELIKEDADFFYVKAKAGEPWHDFVVYCIEHNYAGIENLSLIPGCVGASPMQNIGAYGVEIKDLFEELEAYHLYDKKIVKFNVKDCEFGYRESIFKRRYRNEFIILNVTFRLRKVPLFNTSYGAIEEELQKMKVTDLSIGNISQAVINIRSGKLPDPKVIGNAGSFFKNPTVQHEKFLKLQKLYPNIPNYSINNQPTDKEQFVKLAAGWLIEQCGWKGIRKGDAGCHAKQALVLVNYGNANGKEIYLLSEEIIESVEEKFGVKLEREVNII